MRHIVVELSSESCASALKELQDYNKQFIPRMEEVCRRLAELGVLEAQAHLQLADGNTGATIDPPVKIDNGYKIVMSGEDVYFVEFGTGDSAATHSYYTPLVNVYPGSWSESHAERYSTYGFWWYGGQKYTETPAYMPMYYAGKKIREELPRIVKEVFGK
jgi:hypothetical protein